ncbi:MAG: DNA polymerase IV [Myxococcales bacterium]|nr:DNA polymerase IV [Myxococcales bacterium]MCB9737196.1 DNA polymerase IV [Deltaproteobacteria bacterium]
MAHAWDRIVVHADMDAFYAAVEQLDDPSLRGRPVIVGGRERRGVVLTASYEARTFGVGSAMPMARAHALCPGAVVVPPRFARYTEISRRIMDVFGDFSPIVEPLSLDEAFIEMTGATGIFGEPLLMGMKIKAAVREATGLAVSVGVASTKYVAKVASDVGKPDGLLVVAPADAIGFLAPLPVSRLWGAGAVVAGRLRALGLETIADVARADPAWLSARLGGHAGGHFHELANARDPRRVEGDRGARSVGSERTLEHDLRDGAELRWHLRRSAEDVGRRLRKKSIAAAGVRVKLKTHDFRSLSRQVLLEAPTCSTRSLYRAAVDLVPRFDDPGPFRLVGLAAYDLRRVLPYQLDLFEQDEVRPLRLERAVDALERRFGPGAVRRADELLHRPRGQRAPDMDLLRAGGEDADAPRPRR